MKNEIKEIMENRGFGAEIMKMGVSKKGKMEMTTGVSIFQNSRKIEKWEIRDIVEDIGATLEMVSYNDGSIFIAC